MGILIVMGVIVACFVGHAVLNKKAKKIRENPPTRIKLIIKITKLISGENRWFVSGRFFINEKNEKIREIKVLNKDKSIEDCSIESNEIKNIMIELKDDVEFLKADKIVFRYFDDDSKGKILIPDKLKLSIIYSVDTIKNTDWESINKDDVINLGEVLEY